MDPCYPEIRGALRWISLSLMWELHEICWIASALPPVWSACPHCPESPPLLGDALCISEIKATKQEQKQICRRQCRAYHWICLGKWQALPRLVKIQHAVRKITAISCATWTEVWIYKSKCCIVISSKHLLNVSRILYMLSVAAHFPYWPNCRCIEQHITGNHS